MGYSPDEANANYAHMLVNTSSGDDNGYVINKLDHFSFDALAGTATDCHTASSPLQWSQKIRRRRDATKIVILSQFTYFILRLNKYYSRNTKRV